MASSFKLLLKTNTNILFYQIIQPRILDQTCSSPFKITRLELLVRIGK